METTWKALVAEFVGTFALIFIGAGAVVLAGPDGPLDLVGVALAHGLVLAIMVSISGHTSGGLFNPAVAAALWVTGKIPTARAGAYVVVQLVAAVAGAFLLKYLVDAQSFEEGLAGAPQVAPGVDVGKAIIIEAVTTFFLVWAVFGTAVDDRGPFGKTAGLTIGLVIAFDILAFGPYTGAAMNPARWFGPALAGGLWDAWYVYILGPLAGGVVAGVAYWATFLRDREPATP